MRPGGVFCVQIHQSTHTRTGTAHNQPHEKPLSTIEEWGGRRGGGSLFSCNTPLVNGDAGGGGRRNGGGGRRVDVECILRAAATAAAATATFS